MTLSSFFATSPSNTGAPRLDVGCHSQDPFYGSQKKTTNTPRILFKNAISCNKVFCMKSAQSMSSQLTKLNKTEQCLASTMLHSVHLCKTLAVNHTIFSPSETTLSTVCPFQFAFAVFYRCCFIQIDICIFLHFALEALGNRLHWKT